MRLKTGIDKLATLDNGLTLYSFAYRWDAAHKYVGVMAQDLLASGHGDAVEVEAFVSSPLLAGKQCDGGIEDVLAERTGDAAADLNVARLQRGARPIVHSPRSYSELPLG